MGSVIVAFSGGTDSAYLAWVATSVLGSAAHCITAESPSYRLGTAPSQSASPATFPSTTNSSLPARWRSRVPRQRTDRCYHCKQELFTQLNALARSAASPQFSMARTRRPRRLPARTQSRPGAGVRSPLDDAGLTKAEIRELSRRADCRRG